MHARFWGNIALALTSDAVFPSTFNPVSFPVLVSVAAFDAAVCMIAAAHFAVSNANFASAFTLNRLYSSCKYYEEIL